MKEVIGAWLASAQVHEKFLLGILLGVIVAADYTLFTTELI